MKKQPEPVTEVAFMTKVKSIRGIKPLIEKALLLYVLITDGDTPRWVKAIVIGALAYLINPVDYATTRVFILKFGNSRIWKVGNSRIWKIGISKIWKVGNSRIWNFQNMEFPYLLYPILY